ncbi:vacuolar protein sorting-associated protein 5 [Folsomia candida]|uniref:Sorting nexin-11 n=1 Tax=Folsomia candida TaxID=158441 RepID=A0A226CZF5_FOLCA|nr:vacuolar protein sorting-associated protein 5 [Folsomia candida]XP_021967089.1 vacuolar protein sorting-associated protein 5 [Folsomia candida]OXA37928.1 Sorting nexin-11 [Folsomia candida]
MATTSGVPIKNNNVRHVLSSSMVTSSSSAPSNSSPVAKLMAEHKNKKHSSSAKSLFLLPPSSPVLYDSPLLRRNAKLACSSSAGGLIEKIKKEDKRLVRSQDHLNHDDNSTDSSSSSLERAARPRSGTPDKVKKKGQTGVNCDDQDVNCTVFQVEEFGSKRWIRVEVIEPVTITAKNFLHLNTSFTTYLIRIETNHYAFSLPLSQVRRRYSEFCWLRNKLSHHHPNKVVPPLPAKHFFNMTNFNGNIINQRRYGLGKFLQRVFRSSVLLSDSALHLFLQTDLTTKEIDARVSEEQGSSVGSDHSGANNIPLTGLHSSSHNDGHSQQKRPYLFRSVSLSTESSSEGNGGPSDSEHSDDHGQNTFRRIGTSDEECEHYCDVSSEEEEYEVDVET